MTQTKDQSVRGTALLPGEERRRSQRVIIRVPVTLEVTENGKSQRIIAHTVAVNVHGAMIISKETLDADTNLTVMNDRTAKKAEARVTRTPRESAEGFLIPIEFTSSLPDFWQITFPPANWKPSDS